MVSKSSKGKKGGMDMKYIIGAAVGAVLGYFVFYRLIGCSGGTCPITSNPYTSIVYGGVLGVLLSAQF